MITLLTSVGCLVVKLRTGEGLKRSTISLPASVGCLVAEASASLSDSKSRNEYRLVKSSSVALVLLFNITALEEKVALCRVLLSDSMSSNRAWSFGSISAADDLGFDFFGLA